MPTISLFYGIVIQMYWRDHNPPHIHAHYQGHEALFAISDASVIAGKLPPTARGIVEGWIERRRPELLANWERARRYEALEMVPGADIDD